MKAQGVDVASEVVLPVLYTTKNRLRVTRPVLGSTSQVA